MNNKLVRFDSVIRMLQDAYPDIIEESPFAYLIAEAHKLPAVPQEMTARELFNAYQRICEEYSHKGISIRCDECPLYSICPEIGRAIRVMVIWSTIIERWAREHPETDMMTAKYALPKIDFEERSES